MKIVKTGVSSASIEDEMGRTIAVALQLANLRWGAFSRDGIRLTVPGVSFSTANDVLKFIKLSGLEAKGGEI